MQFEHFMKNLPTKLTFAEETNDIGICKISRHIENFLTYEYLCVC